MDSIDLTTSILLIVYGLVSDTGVETLLLDSLLNDRVRLGDGWLHVQHTCVLN